MERHVGFGKAFILFWKNYINFKGRSTREEFWWWILWYFIIDLLFLFIGLIGFVLISSSSSAGQLMGTLFLIGVIFLWVFFALVTFVPMLTLKIRRFHDTGRKMIIPIVYFVLSNGLSVFANFIPDDFYDITVLAIVFLIFVIVNIILFVYIVIVAVLPTRK